MEISLAVCQVEVEGEELLRQIQKVYTKHLESQRTLLQTISRKLIKRWRLSTIQIKVMPDHILEDVEENIYYFHRFILADIILIAAFYYAGGDEATVRN